MNFTLQEIIDLSVQQATAGIDATLITDAEITAEPLLPNIFQQVGREAARNERTRSILSRAKTATFTNGTATLSDDVLTEYKEDSTFYDTADLTKEYSLVREWADFIQPRTGYQLLLGSYCIRDGVTIGVVEPGANYAVGSGVTGNRALVIPCVPVIPTLSTDVVVMPDEVANNVIEALAVALRGQAEREKAAA